MIAFLPVEKVSSAQMAEFMEDKWTDSSYLEDLTWDFDMDATEKLMDKIFETTPKPHGIAAVKRGAVVGLLIGVMGPSIAEPSKPMFQSLVFYADHCGPQLLKETERLLPPGTEIAITVQKKNAERFSAFAHRYGFIETDTVFVKQIGG